MKTIERKRYYQPVIKIIKMKPLTLRQESMNTDTGEGGGSTGGQQSRGFFFEDEE